MNFQTTRSRHRLTTTLMTVLDDLVDNYADVEQAPVEPGSVVPKPQQQGPSATSGNLHNGDVMIVSVVFVGARRS